MKRILFSCIIFLCSYFMMNAQIIEPNALGIRFGGGDGISAEISYQKKVKENARIEMDFGYRSKSNSYDAFKFTGLYQWVWEIDNGFNWYVGAGGSLGSWDSKHNVDDGFYLNFDGDIGIEYNSEFPVVVSIDLRPEIGLLGSYDEFQMDLALGIRYQF